MFTASAEKKKTEHDSATPDQGMVVLEHLGTMLPTQRTLSLWTLNTFKEPFSMLKFLKPLWVLLLPLYKDAYGTEGGQGRASPLSGTKKICAIFFPVQLFTF